MEAFKEDVPGALKLWIDQGIEHPIIYIDSFLSNTIGYWYPDMKFRDWAAWHPYIEYDMSYLEGQEDVYLFIQRDSKIPWLSDKLSSFAYNTNFQNIPVLSMLFSPGFMFWIMILFIVICLYYKKYRLTLPAILLFGLWLTLMLSLVVLLRYAYPLFICAPLEIAVLFGGHSQQYYNNQTENIQTVNI